MFSVDPFFLLRQFTGKCWCARDGLHLPLSARGAGALPHASRAWPCRFAGCRAAVQSVPKRELWLLRYALITPKRSDSAAVHGRQQSLGTGTPGWPSLPGAALHTQRANVRARQFSTHGQRANTHPAAAAHTGAGPRATLMRMVGDRTLRQAWPWGHFGDL